MQKNSPQYRLLYAALLESVDKALREMEQMNYGRTREILTDARVWLGDVRNFRLLRSVPRDRPAAGGMTLSIAFQGSQNDQRFNLHKLGRSGQAGQEGSRSAYDKNYLFTDTAVASTIEIRNETGQGR